MARGGAWWSSSLASVDVTEVTPMSDEPVEADLMSDSPLNALSSGRGGRGLGLRWVENEDEEGGGARM